jgi:hypothetical protein
MGEPATASESNQPYPLGACLGPSGDGASIAGDGRRAILASWLQFKFTTLALSVLTDLRRPSPVLGHTDVYEVASYERE